MTKTRVEKAQEAFRKKDLIASYKAHTQEAINRSLFHQEEHTLTFTLSDVILGGQDGLVNVLGVILGVAAASGNSQLVIAAGLAAVFAESISMAAVAYTSTLSESDHYKAELEREKWEIEHMPKGEEEEIRQIYKRRGFEGDLLERVVRTITQNKKVWLEVMMGEELKIEPVDKGQALKSAAVVGLSAIVGSLIPLSPFFILPLKLSAVVSILITAIVLFVVGYYKAKITIGKPAKSGLEIALIGITSALIGYLIGSLFKVSTN